MAIPIAIWNFQQLPVDNTTAFMGGFESDTEEDMAVEMPRHNGSSYDGGFGSDTEEDQVDSDKEEIHYNGLDDDELFGEVPIFKDDSSEDGYQENEELFGDIAVSDDEATISENDELFGEVTIEDE